MELKVRVLDKCPNCQGKAYLLVGKAQDLQGKEYERYSACAECEGSGMKSKWIDLADFAVLLMQATCVHEHVASTGSFHLSDGEPWDNLEEVCSDCGKVMR